MTWTFRAAVISSAAAVLFGAAAPGMFESKSRVIATGRDPMLSVRASGALSLMKVDKGDLWLQTSFDGGDSFDSGVRINDVQGEVSSHGESSPQLQVRTRSEFYALWQTRRGGGDGSSLRFSRSTNWGEGFSKAIDVDTTPGSSQSFFSMNVSPKGIVYAVWIDGRDRGKGKQGTAAVYIARSTNKGVSFEKAVRVSLDVCPCCRPTIGFSKDRMYVSWRGVLGENVRDIFVASSIDEGLTWSGATRVAEDNWVLNGCPHSGASMAALGDRLFIAWHAVRDKQAKLYLSYSDDGGKSFSKRADLSESVIDPNHPYMLATGGKIAMVFQGRNAAQGEGWAPINAFYREFDGQGRLTPLERIANAAGSAAYPTFAFEEPGRLYVAWTEPQQESKVVVLSRGRR